MWTIFRLKRALPDMFKRPLTMMTIGRVSPMRRLGDESRTGSINEPIVSESLDFNNHEESQMTY